jgi:hypothetical protein
LTRAWLKLRRPKAPHTTHQLPAVKWAVRELVCGVMMGLMSTASPSIHCWVALRASRSRGSENSSGRATVPPRECARYRLLYR